MKDRFGWFVVTFFVCTPLVILHTPLLGMADRIPLNQQELLSSSSSYNSEEEEDDDLVNEDVVISTGTSVTPPVSSNDKTPTLSFQDWFENDRNVIPDNRIAYLLMMMQTIDNTFAWDARPFDQHKKEKGIEANVGNVQARVAAANQSIRDVQQENC